MGYNWAKEKMKKLVLPIVATIMIVLCSSFVLRNQSNNKAEANNPQCSYNVYGDGQTNDGWYLRISYDCDCPDPVVVKISYEIKNGKNGSVRSNETTCTLWNRKGSPIVGHYSNYYDDNTTRYRVRSVQLK